MSKPRAMTKGERVSDLADRIHKFGLAVAVVGIVASFFLQGAWYSGYGAGPISWVTPILFDLVAFSCVNVIQLPDMGHKIKVAAWCGLVATVGWIGYACVAGSHNYPSAVAHAGPTGLYLFLEALANAVDAKAQLIREIEAAHKAEEDKRRAFNERNSVNAQLRTQLAEVKAALAAATAPKPAPKPRAKPVKPLTVAEMERPGYPQAPTTGAPTGTPPGDEFRRQPRGPYKEVVGPRQQARRDKAARERAESQVS